jgi:hypothetical protein
VRGEPSPDKAQPLTRLAACRPRLDLSLWER